MIYQLRRVLELARLDGVSGVKGSRLVFGLGVHVPPTRPISSASRFNLKRARC
jgi:hypothetical protein